MTKAETMKILAVLKVAYPAHFQKQDYEEKKQMVELWTLMFADWSYAAMDAAVRAHIATSKFPPSVAEITEQLQKFSPTKALGEAAAWGCVSRAIRNSAYRAGEEWEKLPEQVQQVVSPELLRSWSMVSTAEAETVIQSQFLKTYREAQKRRKEFEVLPVSVQRFALSAQKGEGGLLLKDAKLHDLSG